eukprot:scaffold387_cov136-Skeletonema_menzelii.AAC.6
MNSNIQKPLQSVVMRTSPATISTASLALWIEIEMLQQWTDNDDDLETRTPSVILDILFSDSSSSSSLMMMRTTIMGTSAT